MAPSSSSAASIHATVDRIPTIPQLPAARPQRSFSLAPRVTRNADLRCRRRLLTARGDYESWPPDDDDDGDEQRDSSDQAAGFDAAVALFNGGDFHACHDVVEELWYTAEEPTRTLLHAILQCAVGFHHLFNQNHRGAMMELGEGLCKLRKLRLDDDDDAAPFSHFEEEVAAALNFVYRTQKELAACTDDLCLTMDGSASSYQLLGNFAAGQQLYRLETAGADGVPSIIFSAASTASAAATHRVKLPALRATEQHLAALQCTTDYI
ncbi:hypothetical protein ABZP36_033962 [Zizania latifolia]